MRKLLPTALQTNPSSRMNNSTATPAVVRHHLHASLYCCCADEPVKPFEQLDEESLRLLDAIQERQAYIQAGA